MRLAEGLREPEGALVKGAGGRVIAVCLADQGAVGQRVRLHPAVADLLRQAQRLLLACPGGGEVADFDGEQAEVGQRPAGELAVAEFPCAG
jgi:hypothetical protein